MNRFDKILLVAARDFWAIVQTKSFLIGLLALVFIGSVMPAMILLSQLPSVYRIGIIDPAGTTLPELEAKLKEPRAYGLAALTPGIKENHAFVVTELPAMTTRVEAVRARAIALLEAKQLSIIIEVGTAANGEPAFTVTYASLADRVPSEVLKDIFDEIIHEHRAALLGIPTEKIRALNAPISLQNQKRQSGVTQQISEFDFAIAFLKPVMLIFALFGLISFQAERLLTALMEEKLKRLLEVLLTRMTIAELLLGKMLGILYVGIVLYVGVAGLILLAAHGLGLLHGFHAAGFFWFTVYYVTGFFLYASLYASVGAACASPKDAENMAMPLRMLLMIPIMASVYVTTHPESPASVFFSFLPLTAPFVMTNRLALLDLNLWQPVVATISILLAATAGLWMATRIFRASILAQSRSLTFTEVWRALRGQ